jgi:hypothetical protein
VRVAVGGGGGRFMRVSGQVSEGEKF